MKRKSIDESIVKVVSVVRRRVPTVVAEIVADRVMAILVVLEAIVAIRRKVYHHLSMDLPVAEVAVRLVSLAIAITIRIMLVSPIWTLVIHQYVAMINCPIVSII